MRFSSRAVVSCVLVGAAPLALAAAACSKDDDASASATDAAIESSTSDRRDVAELPPVDAGADHALPPPPVLPGCVGTAMRMTTAGERAYVTVQMGPGPVDAGSADADPDASDAAVDAARPQGDFAIDFGTSGSTIDFKAFAPGPAPVPTSCSGDAGAPGAFCTFQGFDFFGDWGFVTLRTDDYSHLATLTRQAGLIGTDFLSLYPFTLDYTRGQIWKSEVASFCTDVQLLGAGLTPLPSSGFFTTDLSKLRPLSDVLDDPDGGTVGFTVPNVPTVPIAIAGVSALGQLDTGYDDRLIRHSINVNQALFDRLLQTGSDRLTRDELSDVYLTTCVPGFSEKVLAYRLAAGQTVDFIAEGGSVARREDTAVVYVKEKLPETERCGGISTWTVPAAQIGSSFFVDAQVVAFDPHSSRVWIPKN